MSFGEEIKVAVFFLLKHVQQKRNAITHSRTDYKWGYRTFAVFLLISDCIS
jgi:hypothetical protein